MPAPGCRQKNLSTGKFPTRGKWMKPHSEKCGTLSAIKYSNCSGNYSIYLCMLMKQIETIVFDLGGVLVDWNPDYVYRTIFKDEEKMRWFYANICTPDWNEQQDAGCSLKEATE